MKLIDVIENFLELPSQELLQIAVLSVSWICLPVALICFARAIAATPPPPQPSDIGHLRFPDIAAYFRGKSAADDMDELLAGVLELPHPDTMREARR